MAPKSKKGGKEKKPGKSKSKSSLGGGSGSASRKSLGGREPSAAALRGSVDFEAGTLFERFDREARGSLTREQFQDMWREYAALKSTAGAAAEAK
eukprot:CAMPEP_0118860696 /NCGR_PEP_ID=MMETSP1163-20130328/6465_1 /TAXON_ID=124430 /ORGANISM="Phaeomonas parva, Strain CCMP2877" /LENGTH=94 /DNA_ID=CAMNT_0006794419 /DNA_START=18 /DNA_END=299 /DNA_ORIENTATION=+